MCKFKAKMASWFILTIILLTTNAFAAPPGSVTPDSPGSSSGPGPTLDTLRPTLRWNRVTGATHYAVAISKFPYGTANIIWNPQRETGTSVTVPAGILQPGTRYRWNLQAGNSSGWGPIPPTLYFQTPATAPQVKTLSLQSTPVNGVDIDITPSDINGNRDGVTNFVRQYAVDTVVNITAPQSAEGKSFSEWTWNGLTYSNTRTIYVPMNVNLTLVAVYKTATSTKTLSFLSTPSTGISISLSKSDRNGQRDGQTAFVRSFDTDTTVTASAPSTWNGLRFQNWTRNGVAFTSSRSATITASDNYAFAANYQAAQEGALLGIDSSPDAGAQITISPSDISGNGSGATPRSLNYNPGVRVTLTAPSTHNGRSFSRWLLNGEFLSYQQSSSITVSADAVVTAEYLDRSASLTVQSSPGAGVTMYVTPLDDDGPAPVTPFTRGFNDVTTVSITAPEQHGGKVFSQWKKNGSNFSQQQAISCEVRGNTTLEAVYLSAPQLKIESSEAGTAARLRRVGSQYLAENVLLPATRLYATGTQVEITADPTAPNGRVFARWIKNGTYLAGRLTVRHTIGSADTLRAEYVAPSGLGFLKRWNGSDFVDISGPLNLSMEHLSVLIHGQNFNCADGDVNDDDDLAGLALDAQEFSSVVLAWDWKPQACGIIPPTGKVGAQGQQLAKTLINYTSGGVNGFPGTVHLMGHSLGAGVATYATQTLVRSGVPREKLRLYVLDPPELGYVTLTEVLSFIPGGVSAGGSGRLKLQPVFESFRQGDIPRIINVRSQVARNYSDHAINFDIYSAATLNPFFNHSLSRHWLAGTLPPSPFIVNNHSAAQLDKAFAFRGNNPGGLGYGAPSQLLTYVPDTHSAAVMPNSTQAFMLYYAYSMHELAGAKSNALTIPELETTQVFTDAPPSVADWTSSGTFSQTGSGISIEANEDINILQRTFELPSNATLMRFNYTPSEVASAAYLRVLVNGVLLYELEVDSLSTNAIDSFYLALEDPATPYQDVAFSLVSLNGRTRVELQSVEFYLESSSGADEDGDGLTDWEEYTGDPDGDGVPNFRDADSDGDGIDDAVEANIDSDSDGISNYLDFDSDNDGAPDGAEGTDDSNSNGVPDYLEIDGEIHVFQPGPEGIDTYCGSVYGQSGCPDCVNLSMGGWGDEYIDYFRFDISSLPNATATIKAELHLSIDRSVNDPQFSLERITQDWTESSITYATQPSAVGYLSSVFVPLQEGTNSVDITSLYKGWQDGSFPNYGFRLRPTQTWESNGGIASSDNLDPTLRPKLVVYSLDSTPPQLSLLGEAAITIECSSIYEDAGAIAIDNFDGDLNASIITTDSAIDTSGPGVHTVHYEVSDSRGNVSAIERTVTVVDTTRPEISLLGSNPFTLDYGVAYLEEGAVVSDNCDTSVQSSLQITGAVDSNTAGVYNITYSGIDAAGNEAVSLVRAVIVLESYGELPPEVQEPDDEIVSNLTVTILAPDFAEAVEGTPFTLTAEVTDPIGDIIVQWYRVSDVDNGLVPLVNGNGLELIIPSISFPDTGRYLCQVSDEVDTAQSQEVALSVVVGLPAASSMFLLILSLLLCAYGVGACPPRTRRIRCPN